MLNWFRRILGLCEHDWQDFKTVKVFLYEGDKMPMHHEYIQQCSKCKRYRKQRL